MAFGYFEFHEPGLTYSLRDSYRTDLPIDPDSPDAVIEGEWLSIDTDQKLIRDESAVLQYPVLVDKARTDTQSNQGRLTVGRGPKGARARTSGYALNEEGAALVYAIGDNLVVAETRDANGNSKYFLAQEGATPVVTPSAEGDIVAIGTQVVARLVRLPYQLSGVGVGSRRTVIDIELV